MKEKISYWINKELKKNSDISEEDDQSLSEIYKYLVCHYLITNNEDCLTFHDSKNVRGWLFISDEFCKKYYDEFSFVKKLSQQKQIYLDKILLNKVINTKIIKVNRLLKLFKYKDEDLKEVWLEIPKNLILKMEFKDLFFLIFKIFAFFKSSKKLAYRFYVLEDEKILIDFINSLDEKNVFNRFPSWFFSLISSEETKEVFTIIKKSKYFFYNKVISLCKKDSIINPQKSKNILKLIQEYMR